MTANVWTFSVFGLVAAQALLPLSEFEQSVAKNVTCILHNPLTWKSGLQTDQKNVKVQSIKQAYVCFFV